jgi:hypothetical protein
MSPLFLKKFNASIMPTPPPPPLTCTIISLNNMILNQGVGVICVTFVYNLCNEHGKEISKAVFYIILGMVVHDDIQKQKTLINL